MTDGYVLRNLLGFKYDVILGYQSGGDIDLAMLRSETQGRANVAWDGLRSRNPDWIRDGKISVLYQRLRKKSTNSDRCSACPRPCEDGCGPPTA